MNHRDNETAYRQKRERLLATIEFRHPDRMPVCCVCCGEAAMASVTGRSDYRADPKGFYADAMRAWDVDLVKQFVLPHRLDRQVGPMAQVELSAVRGVLPRLFYEWKQAQGFQTPEDFRDFCLSLPDPSEAARFVDREKTGAQWLALDRWGDFLRPAVWVPGHLAGLCRWMWYGVVGYEIYLMAHVLYPEAVERLFAFSAEEAFLQNQAIAATIRAHDLMPLIYSGEDICGNDGPLCSPHLLSDIYFPHLKRSMAPIVDEGIHWMWHSDGNIIPILDDLLACGVDGFQGFEEDKGMDLEQLIWRRCRNGKFPFICGSVSVTTTMYEGKEAIRKEKQRMQNLFEKRGGVILSPSSTIMEDTPVEHVLELMRRGTQEGERGRCRHLTPTL